MTSNRIERQERGNVMKHNWQPGMAKMAGKADERTPSASSGWRFQFASFCDNVSHNRMRNNQSNPLQYLRFFSLSALYIHRITDSGAREEEDAGYHTRQTDQDCGTGTSSCERPSKGTFGALLDGKWIHFESIAVIACARLNCPSRTLLRSRRRIAGPSLEILIKSRSLSLFLCLSLSLWRTV